MSLSGTSAAIAVLHSQTTQSIARVGPHTKIWCVAGDVSRSERGEHLKRLLRVQGVRVYGVNHNGKPLSHPCDPSFNLSHGRSISCLLIDQLGRRVGLDVVDTVTPS